MGREIKLSIDAMGGDSGPATLVAGVAVARRRHPSARFLLHGDESTLKPLLRHYRALENCAEIRHAPEVIGMAEKPSQVVRRGRNSSMWHAVNSVAEGEADVAVSAGNTGALMAISLVRLRAAEGISRPAIAVIWPTIKGHCIVLDVGANAGCDADQLVDFAVMGEAFSRAVFGIERPTVGLLNIGEEAAKGIEPVKRAARILRASNLPIEFSGFIEGDDIGAGAVDVVVTDGFTGNVALKTAEGTARLVTDLLNLALKRTLFGRIGGLIARGCFRAVSKKLDPRTGGVFLGLNGLVVKSHGSADANGFASAIDLAVDMSTSDMLARIMADKAGVELDAEADAPDISPAPQERQAAIS
nr:MAG: phosphate acyltransferase PlsX [Hyphomicrobiales bacterium]